MKKNVIYWMALGLVVMIGCGKELSFELGGTPSTGSLQSDVTGDCLPKTVNGIYAAATPLVPAVNTISIQVNVLQTGTYVISTDTVNGFYFRATGTFTALGAVPVTLRSNGTPFAVGITNFVVSYDSTICDIAVTVLPAGAGAAVFTLAGAPGNCTGAVINGSYLMGAALNASNYVDISVNVTSLGTYNITTTFQGMTFSGSGLFAATGPQTVRLFGSGTPTTIGSNTVPLTVGSTTCSFSVSVVGPAGFTFNCASVAVNGVYETGTALTSTNTVVLQVNATVAGAYSISTTAVNGMVFSGSGTLALGAGTITLTGSGTPITATTSNITVTFGTANCSFNVTVTAGASVDWSFTQGTTNYQGHIDNASLMQTAPFTTFSFTGSNAISEIIVLGLTDLAGGITNNETYSTATTTSNSAGFVFNTSAGDVLTADQSTAASGGTLIFKVTSHNTVTKTLTGTFSGTVKNFAGTTLTVTNGQFTGTYP